MSEEDELIAQTVSSLDAWNDHDADRIFDEAQGEGGMFGFGFRARDARVDASPEQAREGLRAFFASVDWYRIEDVETQCMIDGDVAIVFGFFTEDFCHTGMEPERIRVRQSGVLHRSNGHWRRVWSHRDAQEFADDGTYIRN